MTDDEDETRRGAGHPGHDDRPLGYRLRVVDALISREFSTTLRDAGVSRREWMVLNVLAGEVDAPGFAERIRRGGKRMRFLAERGWAADEDGAWVLTDEGRAAHERLSGVVAGIRDRVAGAVSADDYATLTASLDAIATALGADEMDADGTGLGPFGRRGFGPFGRRGPGGFPVFGPDFAGFSPGADDEGGPGRGFGSGRGVRPGSGFAPEYRPGGHCGHGRHHDHRDQRGRSERGSQKAYERGFDAGYTRGKDSVGA